MCARRQLLSLQVQKTKGPAAAQPCSSLSQVVRRCASLKRYALPSAVALILAACLSCCLPSRLPSRAHLRHQVVHAQPEPLRHVDVLLRHVPTSPHRLPRAAVVLQLWIGGRSE